MRWDNLKYQMNSAWLFEKFYEQWPEADQRYKPGLHDEWECGLLKVDRWRVDRIHEKQTARLVNTVTNTCIVASELDLYVGMKIFLKRLAGYDGRIKSGYALVLAGGGAKGAYQIGVWGAMKKLGIDIRVTGIAGTSIGAVNALLFALGDYENACKLWLTMTNPKALEAMKDEMMKVRGIRGEGKLHSILSQKLLERELRKAIGGRANELHQKYHIFSAATPYESRLDNQRPDFISWNTLRANEIITAVLASAALPLIYDPVSFKNKLYLDGGIKGGVSDNVPYRPLYDCGYRNFIVVYLGHQEEVSDTLNAMSKLKDCRVINVVPGSDFDTNMTAMLDMSNPKHTQQRIEAGLRDGMAALKPEF